MLNHVQFAHSNNLPTATTSIFGAQSFVFFSHFLPNAELFIFTVLIEIVHFFEMRRRHNEGGANFELLESIRMNSVLLSDFFNNNNNKK